MIALVMTILSSLFLGSLIESGDEGSLATPALTALLLISMAGQAYTLVESRYPYVERKLDKGEIEIKVDTIVVNGTDTTYKYTIVENN